MSAIGERHHVSGETVASFDGVSKNCTVISSPGRQEINIAARRSRPIYQVEPGSCQDGRNLALCGNTSDCISLL